MLEDAYESSNAPGSLGPSVFIVLMLRVKDNLIQRFHWVYFTVLNQFRFVGVLLLRFYSIITTLKC